MTQVTELNPDITILVVDDEKVIRQSIADQLEDLGYRVLLAEHGRDGLQLMEMERPDVVLTDLRMSVMGGLEMIQVASQQYPNIAIIVISGAGQLADAVAALRFGAYDYLIKPVNDLGILEHTINKALEKVRLLTENEDYKKHLEQLVDERTLALAKANQALSLHKIQLEQLVEVRTSELQQSYQHLQQTQNQLIESAKMASLGGLVAGVAHEINTPIGICVTAASFLQGEIEQLKIKLDDRRVSRRDVNQLIEGILESSDLLSNNIKRASDLVTGFKQLAVDVSGEELSRFNLYSYIGEVIQYLHTEFKHSQHQIELSGTHQLIVESFPGAILQVISELVGNSLCHAFTDLKPGHIYISIRREGEMATINYSDDGIGMDEATMAKIYEPFFTTRRYAGSRGLGMHLLYNQVSQILQGKIRCSSITGKGTRFKIIFPLKAMP
ncbi:hybrid sensor histidine kinase/response regulator [Agarivorans sp. QJM3NY_33]|uniref:hybrid sensor histidine kinase/response regulator n=1 Tax=Agarivorans sp. QJM3NY_33 TaxID=3421432 RepID=UPI003D7E7995